MVKARAHQNKQEQVEEETMELPRYVSDYFDRVNPLEWKLSHFLHNTVKSRPSSLSREQVLRAFKTGLENGWEGMFKKKRLTIFGSEVTLEAADMTKSRNITGAKLCEEETSRDVDGHQPLSQKQMSVRVWVVRATSSPHPSSMWCFCWRWLHVVHGLLPSKKYASTGEVCISTLLVYAAVVS
ncbi:18980_t:CDS:2 [Rhizophagus irregularis]|nr:18980_t:CDS:2 [Rhizophagus irregularis]